VIGPGYQVIEKDLKSVKNSLNNYIKNDYQKYDYYPHMGIVEPILKNVEVSIRPAYRNDTSYFPFSKSVKVSFPVIYGETAHNQYECYLPIFGEHFYYHNKRQFNALVSHFATNALNRMAPEKIFQICAYPRPKLEKIILRTKRNNNPSNPVQKKEFQFLNRLAERYPYAKNIRKNMSSFPDAAWELEDKVNDVVEKIINQRSNVLIIGGHGVGKSAVLKQAIQKIDNTSRKQGLKLTFWRIMAQRITTSTKYLGEWQAQCEKLVENLSLANGVLWVIDVIKMMQMGGQGSQDSVAAFLSSFLQKGKLQMIGEATPEELESMRRLLPGFVQNFQVIRLEELSEKKVQSILSKFADYSAQNLRIKIDQQALNLTYRLLYRYYPYEKFPGKAVQFLGQCVSDASINEKTQISTTNIIQNFIKRTGLPEMFLRDDLLLDAEKLTQYFQSRIMGQESAIQQLAEVVKIFKAGLNNPYKPITTLVFAGPTGVGKTASAQALADYFFGKGQKESPLIRIDMSEYKTPSQINRFFGNGREVGKLVQDIRRKPFSVLLLDEVEKADRSIFDALLTVLDEGMLVDAFGRVTNFRNTVIIMTTNLGSTNRASVSYINTNNTEDAYESAIKAWFRPEFVNRLDGIVGFNSLNKKHIEKISEKEIKEFIKREGFIKRGLKIEYTKNVVQYLSRIGFDERYGARPLQRALESYIMSPMANWLLKNPKLKNTTLEIDFVDKLTITKKKK